MARQANPYTFDHKAIPVFHDHLEGSAHCIECQGPCRLTDPTQQALTSLVRALFEAEARGFKPDPIPYRIQQWFEGRGIDVNKFREHARAAAQI